MAALGSRLVTLADVAKSKNKQIGMVAEVLTLSNPMLNDVPFMEMNEGTIHKEEIRSGLPALYYRKANEAIPASKSTTEERTFGAAHFESKSQIDSAVAKRGGVDRINYNRWNQAQGHIQAHANELASLLIYGSTTDATEKTQGFFDVYSQTSGSEASKQVLDAGGSTGSALSSILLSYWGENSIFGVYPKGTSWGLTRTDRSAGNKEVQIQATDRNGNPGSFWGYEENFMTDSGLVIKDYRQGARIANIDIDALKSKVGAADLTELMIMAYHKIANRNNGKGTWYMNSTLMAHGHIQARKEVGAGGGFTYANYQGGPVLTFMGLPVRLSDAILDSEAEVL